MSLHQLGKACLFVSLLQHKEPVIGDSQIAAGVCNLQVLPKYLSYPVGSGAADGISIKQSDPQGLQDRVQSAITIGSAALFTNCVCNVFA